jgi:hypothetical protein
MEFREILMIVGIVSILAPAWPLGAQTNLGTLRGTVVDEQGGALPGVTVTARQTATNTTQTAVTGGAGE